MRVTAGPASWGALAALLAVAAGCSGQPKGGAPKADPPKPPPVPGNPAPSGGKAEYRHGPSAVGFLSPDGWENLGVKERGPITTLGLRKGQGAIEVTLYWSAPDEPITDETVGEVEWAALRTLYGDKIGRPEPIIVRGKTGYRLRISGGPLGTDTPGLDGVVYVFAVKAGEDWWKIKLRATVQDKEQLAEVAKLLDNYRW